MTHYPEITVTLQPGQKEILSLDANWLVIKSLSYKALFALSGDGYDYKQVSQGKCFYVGDREIRFWNKGKKELEFVAIPCSEKDQKLYGASCWQVQPKKTSVPLNDAMSSYFKHRSRTFEKNSSIVDAWQRIVPVLLQDYCRLDKRVGNTLYVQVLAGPYMHQAQMVCSEWIEQLQQQCPRCGITKIRLIPMRNFEEL